MKDPRSGWQDYLLTGLFHDGRLSDIRLRSDGRRLSMRVLGAPFARRRQEDPAPDFKLLFEDIAFFSFRMGQLGEEEMEADYGSGPGMGREHPDFLSLDPFCWRLRPMLFNRAVELENPPGGNAFPAHRHFHTIRIEATSLWEITVTFRDATIENLDG